MRIAIMQPYFFPYIGQFQLIHMTDRFILMDDVQYIRHGWVNRNRILKNDAGFQYIVAPIRKHSHNTPINKINVVEGGDWKKVLLSQLQVYRKVAPFYSEVYRLLNNCITTNETSITNLNGICFESVCDYIGIRFKKEIASNLNLDYSEIKQTQDWALQISRQLGASEYYNPPGGMELYNKQSFDEYNIQLRFVTPELKDYNQGRPEFTPGLSIIDVMMFNSPADILKMLNDCQII